MSLFFKETVKEVNVIMLFKETVKEKEVNVAIQGDCEGEAG